MHRTRFFLLGLLVVAVPCRVTAQVSPIAAIRAHYQAVERMIASGAEDLWRDVVQINTTSVPSPGTGPVRTWLRLYSVVEYPTEEGGEPLLVLAKAENTSEISGTVFYEEYLYGKSGELEFFYRKRAVGDGGVASTLRAEREERLYFAGGVLIQTILDGVLSTSPDEEESRLGAAILRKAQAIRAVQSVRSDIPPAFSDPLDR